MNIFRISADRSFFRWGWILFIWTIVALVSASMLHIKLVAGGGSSNWGNLFLIKLVIWLFWGFLTPFIFYTGKKFRVDRKGKFKGLLFHIPASLLLVSLNIFLYALIVTAVNEPSFTGSELMAVFMALLINLFEWYFIIYWAIILVGYAFEYYDNNRLKEIEKLQVEARLIKSQLRALKMQLHPHFLFNTLNTIAGQIRFNEQQNAIKMLTGLSELLRMALQQKEQQLVPLKEEMTFIEQYLSIEKIRFGERFKLSIKMAPETENLQVPSFLLQPLVENAIYHGIAKQLAAEYVEVECYLEGNELNIRIYNDGPQLPADFDIRNSGGIGLSTSIERLDQLFPDKDTFELRNTGKGVEAIIRLPIT